MDVTGIDGEMIDCPEWKPIINVTTGIGKATRSGLRLKVSINDQFHTPSPLSSTSWVGCYET